MKNLWTRIVDELSQAWIVTLKDIKVYYLRPGMIMFGFLMPFFMFFSSPQVPSSSPPNGV